MRSQRLRLSLALILASCLLIPVQAQKAGLPANRGVDEESLSTLHGTVHPLARTEFDQGAVADDLPLQRMLLMMARPAGRENDLQQFLRDVHSPGSAVYHQWLTPEEFGARFGAADEDAQLVSGWLQSHGMSVARVTKGKWLIEFSGTAGQVREALHTQIHRYSIDGKTYFANASEIAVPQAIAKRIRGFAPLNGFPLDSYVKLVGGATMNRANHRVAPQFTVTENNAPFYALGPEDFATQYDAGPVYAAGTNGMGQTIGILGEGNLNLALVDAYRKLFNLPADHTQVIIDGQDPGDGAEPNVEGYLDVEVSGAVAPGATVNFYIAGAEGISGVTSTPLALAALRAVEDNQASVLSASFGDCEQVLGEAGNQLWAGLWEQAAAQGQTVFVSSGDSGPTACPALAAIEGSTIVFLDSLNVNGLSSTPWNVSVGGTDFYYSDHASGAPSAAKLWNQTNDSSNGSLKAPLPEQVWDSVFGFDVVDFFPPAGAEFFDYPVAAVAGGGGVSNCSQETVTTPALFGTCLAGYAKPDWQNAPGVPDDQARDLPDVSLFASNGMNLSAVPLCAEPGDCAPVTTGDPQITLVGGTSVSSPSMAGVMALIDQKYGRQGQANYTLYALARQYPSVFHDITQVSNDIVCPQGTSPECDVLVPNQTFNFYSYGEYAAGPGYDLASGLGSVDVSQLVNNWNKVTFAASTTTLQASPASVVHGSAVTASVAVTANSGSATPTGNVALVASAGTSIPANAPLTLTNGTASASLTNLPGGNYQLTAQYGGDATFAGSASTPAALTVTPEGSTTELTVDYFSPPTANPLPSGEIAYGARVPFEAVPSGAASKTTGLATGTVVFTDGAVTDTVLLDGKGVATWRPQSFAIGAHSVTASYSGDASYEASTSTPVALTVVKVAPGLEVVPDVMPVGCAVGVTSCGSNGGEVYQPGTDMVASVFMGGGIGTPPSGAVTVSFGSLTQAVNLTAVAGISSAWATFPNIPAGSYALSATYPGDANWNAATFTNATPYVYADSSYTPTTTTTTMTLSPSSVDSSGSVTFNVTTVAASNQNGCFLGTDFATLYAGAASFGFVQMGCSVVNGVPTVSGSAVIPGSELPAGSYQVVAEYAGAGVQLPSFSSPVPLTVTATDFSLSVVSRNVAVAAGKSTTAPVALGGPLAAGITVALSCATSSASLGCTISPGSATVTGSGTASLTINAFTESSAASEKRGAGREGTTLRTGGLALALLALLAVPGRKRFAKLLVSLAVCVGLSVAVGCGSSPTKTVTTGPTIIPTPAGSYSVTVTGISSGITHSSTLNIQVQ